MAPKPGNNSKKSFAKGLFSVKEWKVDYTKSDSDSQLSFKFEMQEYLDYIHRNLNPNNPEQLSMLK